MLSGRGGVGWAEATGENRRRFEPPDGFILLDSRKYGKARIEILCWEG